MTKDLQTKITGGGICTNLEIEGEFDHVDLFLQTKLSIITPHIPTQCMQMHIGTRLRVKISLFWSFYSIILNKYNTIYWLHKYIWQYKMVSSWTTKWIVYQWDISCMFTNNIDLGSCLGRDSVTSHHAILVPNYLKHLTLSYRPTT